MIFAGVETLFLCIGLASTHYKEKNFPYTLKVDYFVFDSVSKHLQGQGNQAGGRARVY